MRASAHFAPDRSHLAALVVASVVAHAMAFVLVPAHVSASAVRASSPIVIEIAALPLAAAPAPPPPTAAAVAAPITASRATMIARAPAPIAKAPSQPEPSTTEANADVPVDFTSTVLSNAEPAMPGESAPARLLGDAKAAAMPLRNASAPAVFVPPGALSRPPGAPGLDVELERNYPPDARRAGISGKAVMRVQIFSDGHVGAVTRVSETRDDFGTACERTVRAGRWQPPRDRDGRAVATEITYVCRFEVGS